MSFCRWQSAGWDPVYRREIPSDAASDLYIYRTATDPPALVCTACDLNDGREFYRDTTPGMMLHVLRHIIAGHRVPRALLGRLIRDQG
jgi:predicted acylesterase/phospholipase RssA